MSRPFARIYYIDLQRDYPSMWANNDLHATYSRLLSLAEASWPVTPEIPRIEKPRYVQVLIDLTLVTRVGQFGYRIKGLDAERTARSTAASNAARIKWGNAERTPDRNAYAPNQTSPDQSNDSPPPQVGRRSEGTSPRQLGTNLRANGHSPRQEREAQKRGALPTSVHDILRRAAQGADS